MTANPRTLSAVVAANARMRPEATAFVEAASGESLTWAAYDAAADAMAATLAAAYAPGDRIALQIPDGPGVHAAMLACERAGIVGVGIGARAGRREVEHLVERTGARALLTTPPPPGAGGPDPTRAIGPDDLWFLNSTSGTTGLPKCVMHNQARWFAFHEYAQRYGDLAGARR